jgi:hypothetical protein
MQQTVGVENHARRTEAALEGIMLDEGLLKRMQVSIVRQSFDGENLCPADVSGWIDTGANGPVVY